MCSYTNMPGLLLTCCSTHNTYCIRAELTAPGRVRSLLHYQLNEGCDVASYIITYGSDNPGTQVLGPSLVSLPASGEPQPSQLLV